MASSSSHDTPDTIHIISGVSAFTGEAFCAVRWNNENGQLSPDEVREMALHWLGAAEAAEQDAVVFKMLTTDMELDIETAGRFLVRMRDLRGNSD